MPAKRYGTVDPKQGDNEVVLLTKLIELLRDENLNVASIEPAANAAAITPDDSNDLSENTRAVFITADGDLKVNMVTSGSGITFVGLKAGMTLPIRVKRVLASGTTASAVALW